MRAREMLALVVLVLSCQVCLAQTPVPERPAAQEVRMTDQFEQPMALSQLNGQVVVIVYCDRDGSDASRELGTALFVAFHPTAAGKTGQPAREAAVRPLPGLAAGQSSTPVKVIPAAAIGEVPALVQKLIRAQFRQGEPTESVWLDFQGLFADRYGLQAGVPNLLIFDTHGRLAYTGWGMPSDAQFQQIANVVENLRFEAIRR